LGIFSELARPRGIGLACRALTEALRRKSAVAKLYMPEQQLEFLKEAEGHANRAVEIFSRDVPERSRLVESLIELGCVCRDRARLQIERSLSSERTSADLAERGENALHQAADEAKGLYPHLALDAQVNLAWLYFYLDKPKQAHAVIQEAFSLVERDYFFSPERGVPQVGLPIAFNWLQIGKAYLLTGLIHKAEFDNTYKDQREEGRSTEEALALTKEHLIQTVQDFTLSLAHDALYAPDFRDVRRAKSLIYREFKGLNFAELDLVRQTVREVEIRYHIPHPSSMWRFLDESFGSWRVNEAEKA